MNDDDEIVGSLDGIARALRALGNGNAATEMGGLEAHGLAIKKAGDAIREGLFAIADEIRMAAEKGGSVDGTE